jgi:hypothetical protein
MRNLQLYNYSLWNSIIDKTRSEQVVFSDVRHTSVSAGDIVHATCTIPSVAKKGGQLMAVCLKYSTITLTVENMSQVCIRA